MEKQMSDAKKIVPFSDKATEMSADVIAQGKAVKKLYGEVEKLAGKVVEKAINLGNMLVELRVGIGHGSFIKYCEDNLGLNYKMCQRYMQVAEYTPKLEQTIEQIPDLATALKETGKIKKEEELARIEKESVWFEVYKSDMDSYDFDVENAPNATDKANVEKPITPWNEEEDRRNIGNRYKAWLAKEKKREEIEASKEEVPEEDLPTLDEMVDAAFQRVMLVFDKLSEEQRVEAIASLQDKLSEGEWQ